MHSRTEKIASWLWSRIPTNGSVPRRGWLIRHLLGMPLIGRLVFLFGSLCPYHLCLTVQYEYEWSSRRWCDRCKTYWDMG